MNVFKTVLTCAIEITNNMKNISERQVRTNVLDLTGPSGV